MKFKANGYSQVTGAGLSFEIPHIGSEGQNTVEMVLGMINSSLHKVWFDRIASVIVYNKQKSNFPKPFLPTNFPISERFVRYWQTAHFITEHKFNHKFEIAVIQITLEYYRLPTSR